MEATKKQCVMCAEDIPLAAKVCPYCEAKYEVRSDGYCLKCHEFREADEAEKCTVCGEAVADWKVKSRLVEQDEKTADERGSTQTKNETADGSGAKQVEKSSAAAPRTTGARRVLMVALVIVVLCGAGFLGWSWMIRQAASTAQKAATTVVRQATAMSTETEPATATMTKTATQTPTRKPQPTATARPPAWVADFAELHLANIAKRPPTFQDDISNEKNSRYFWGRNPGITFNNGIMQLTITNGGLVVGGGRVNDDTPNFILEYELIPRSIASSGGVHVLFRHSNQGYYDLGFYQDGRWEITYEDVETGHHFVTGGKSDQVGVDKKTKVTLIVRRDEMALYLNDQPAGYGRYTAPMANVFTFGLYSPVGTTAVEIDNVKFWDLDSLKPKSE